MGCIYNFQYTMEMTSTSLHTLTTTDNISYQISNIPPGQLQYKVSPETVIQFDIEKLRETNVDYRGTFHNIELHTRENLLRLIPNTETGNSVEWKILLIIRETEGNKICLKGALVNKSTNEIALISSLNSARQLGYEHRLINSHDPEYKVCWSKMIAPLFFWDEIKNRLIN